MHWWWQIKISMTLFCLPFASKMEDKVERAVLCYKYSSGQSCIIGGVWLCESQRLVAVNECCFWFNLDKKNSRKTQMNEITTDIASHVSLWLHLWLVKYFCHLNVQDHSTKDTTNLLYPGLASKHMISHIFENSLD